MNLKQLQAEVKRFRVIDKTNKHYNQEFELDQISYKNFYYQNSEHSTVDSYRGSSIFTFNFSQIQFLTPLKIKNKFIGIGDIITYLDNEYEVYGYYWYNGEYKLRTASNKNYNNCYNFTPAELRSFTFKSQEPQPTQEEIQKAVDLLKKVGKIKNGNILEE